MTFDLCVIDVPETSQKVVKLEGNMTEEVKGHRSFT